MNKVTLIGRLTKDPNLRFTPGAGTAVTTFTLAVNRKFKKEGYPEADFIPIVVWGKMAENTANYMAKGGQVGIAGRIETRSYEKDGTRHYVTEVIAEEVEFLGNKQGVSENETKEDIPNEVTPIESDDIPF